MKRSVTCLLSRCAPHWTLATESDAESFDLGKKIVDCVFKVIARSRSPSSLMFLWRCTVAHIEKFKVHRTVALRGNWWWSYVLRLLCFIGYSAKVSWICMVQCNIKTIVQLSVKNLVSITGHWSHNGLMNRNEQLKTPNNGLQIIRNIAFLWSDLLSIMIQIVLKKMYGMSWNILWRKQLSTLRHPKQFSHKKWTKMIFWQKFYWDFIFAVTDYQSCSITGNIKI